MFRERPLERELFCADDLWLNQVGIGLFRVFLSHGASRLLARTIHEELLQSVGTAHWS